jgi:hypothetical protein
MENDNNRYANGKIYCLRSHQTDNIYIGSTRQPLYKRLHQHKKHKENNLAKYDDVYIELIEEYPCKNRMELCKKEGEHIRANDCVNKIIAGRTQKERYIDNRDKILEYQNQYYIDNRDKKLENQKQYHIDNRDKLLKNQKQYYIDNRDKLKDYNKQYCIANRDKIKEQKKQLYLSKKQSTSSPLISPVPSPASLVQI